MYYFYKSIVLNAQAKKQRGLIAINTPFASACISSGKPSTRFQLDELVDLKKSLTLNPHDMNDCLNHTLSIIVDILSVQLIVLHTHVQKNTGADTNQYCLANQISAQKTRRVGELSK